MFPMFPVIRKKSSTAVVLNRITVIWGYMQYVINSVTSLKIRNDNIPTVVLWNQTVKVYCVTLSQLNVLKEVKSKILKKDNKCNIRGTYKSN